MIMGQGLNCRLRVLIPTAENSIAGNAFRPGDVLSSRAGLSVEIGNTDAEGRLVLADALALADSEAPDSIFVFATLTGAARTALGPDLPAFFTDDEGMAQSLPPLAASIGDPLWRLPLWNGYRRHLDSDIADINNVWQSPFAGAITAALFLQPVRHASAPFCAFRSLWLAAGGPAARTQGRRASDGAGRDGAAEAGAVVVMDEASQIAAWHARSAPECFSQRSGCKIARRHG